MASATLAVLVASAALWLGPQTAAQAANPYLSVSGPNLSYNGQTVTLRGENFNNGTALTCCGSGSIDNVNAGQADYQQVSSMGGNAIRFGLDYAWYANNRAKFYQVTDQHLAWAAAAHLWVIPVMFGPPGGSSGGYNGQGGFWGSQSNQDLLVAFWQDFAGHYAGNTTMAGYDVFNEPAPPSAGAWDAVAQRITNAVGQADPNHFVVLEESSANWNLPSVSGPRILWSSHCYAAVGTNGCNYPGANPQQPSKRPFFIGEVGSTFPNLGAIPSNLQSFNDNGVNWADFVMHEGSYGLYRNYGASDFSNPWTAMIMAVTSSMAGSVRPGVAPPPPAPVAAPAPASIQTPAPAPVVSQAPTGQSAPTGGGAVPGPGGTVGGGSFKAGGRHSVAGSQGGPSHHPSPSATPLLSTLFARSSSSLFGAPSSGSAAPWPRFGPMVLVGLLGILAALAAVRLTACSRICKT